MKLFWFFIYVACHKSLKSYGSDSIAKDPSILLHLNTAKATVESIFDVKDILQAPTSVGSTNDLANLTSKPADQYALQLASLAKIAKQNLIV